RVMFLGRWQRLRRPARRHLGHIGIHGRIHSQSDLRGSLERPHRPRRIRAGRLRPRQDLVREAARRVLAQHRSAPEGRPVLRSRDAVSDRDLLFERFAEARGGSVEGEPRAGAEIQGEDRDTDRAGVEVLSGGGLPPELLQGTPGPVPGLPRGLPPRRAAQRDLGSRGGRSLMRLMPFLLAVPAAAITFAAFAALRAPSPPSPTPAKPAVPPPSGAFHKPSDAELRKQLTPLQYDVTQHEGTERAFSNAYWDNKKPGIYVDVVSGEVLFSSLEKYDSGTGWPSFWKPLEEGNIKTGANISFVGKWAEVRSTQADSHLGHVFDDGPPPPPLRYCMNSAAMRFIPVEDLEKEGYGKYKVLFVK